MRELELPEEKPCVSLSTKQLKQQKGKYGSKQIYLWNTQMAKHEKEKKIISFHICFSNILDEIYQTKY